MVLNMVKTKGEQTKEMILEKAAVVFNRQGYFGASLSDIMAATGLEKGGIYNHFTNKDDLALQAYDYAIEQTEAAFTAALLGQRHAIDRLLALAGVFEGIPDDKPIPGGCPVLNTAVVADDTHPQLLERAQQTMLRWHGTIERIIQRGIERGEIRPEIDPDALATHFFVTLEGAIMLSRLHQTAHYMDQTLSYLREYLETAVRVSER
jgi:TetR/AcrR family transcriptional repressor of nem operon